MNLRDYIGDTRTESLPPGFLKSIKIKYRHEASHVFPRAGPVSRENVEEQNVATETSGGNVEQKDEEKTSEEKEDKCLPNFMSWRVPSRLLNQRQEISRTTSGKNVKDKISEDFKATGNVTSISRQSTSLISVSVRSLNSSSSKRSNESQLGVKESSLVPKSASSKLGSIGKDEVEENVKSCNSKHSNEGKDEIEENSDCVPKSSSSQHSNESKGGKNDEEKEDDDCQVLSSKINDKNEVQESVRVLISRNSKQSIKSGQNMNQCGRTIASGRLIEREHKMKEFPKLDISSQKGSLKYEQVEDKSGLLPRLKSTKERMSTSRTQRPKETLTKLPSSPERVDKIYTWVRKSTSRERQAAYNLLSTFIANEKIQSSKPKKERIKIALQALERKQTPSSIKPLRVNELVQNLTVLNVNQHTSKNRNQSGIYQPTKSEKQESRTWHHLPVYHYTSTDNQGALFVQPQKSYQTHFSIHPHWGLHKQVNKNWLTAKT